MANFEFGAVQGFVNLCQSCRRQKMLQMRISLQKSAFVAGRVPRDRPGRVSGPLRREPRRGRALPLRRPLRWHLIVTA